MWVVWATIVGLVVAFLVVCLLLSWSLKRRRGVEFESDIEESFSDPLGNYRDVHEAYVDSHFPGAAERRESHPKDPAP